MSEMHDRLVAFGLNGRRQAVPVLPLILFLGVTATCWLSTRHFGLPGLPIVVVVMLVAAAAGLLMVFRPELVFVGWIVVISSFTFIGMIRMPGIPDFSMPRLLLILVMVLIALGALTGRSIISRPLLPDLLLLLHTIYVLVNLKLVGNENYFHSWYNSSLAAFVAYIFGKQYITSDRELRRLVYGLMAVLLYYGITAFGEHFEIGALVWPRNIMDRTILSPYFGRARGPFFQPGVFGMMIGMLLLLGMLAVSRPHRPRVSVFLGFIVSLAALALLYTYTRGGWVATIAGFLFLVVLRPRFRRVALVGAFVAVILAPINLISADKGDVLSERISNTNTIENRLGTVATASRMISLNPLFGVGYFRYMELEHLYNRGTNFPLYGYVRREMGAGVPLHDIYIGRAAEEGLISIGLFFWFLATIARELLRKWRSNPAGEWLDRDALAVFGAIVVAYLLGGMVEDFRYFDSVNVLAYFFMGVIVGSPAGSSMRSTGVNPAPPTHGADAR